MSKNSTFPQLRFRALMIVFHWWNFATAKQLQQAFFSYCAYGHMYGLHHFEMERRTFVSLIPIKYATVVLKCESIQETSVESVKVIEFEWPCTILNSLYVMFYVLPSKDLTCGNWTKSMHFQVFCVLLLTAHIGFISLKWFDFATKQNRWTLNCTASYY